MLIQLNIFQKIAALEQGRRLLIVDKDEIRYLFYWPDGQPRNFPKLCLDLGIVVVWEAEHRGYRITKL